MANHTLHRVTLSVLLTLTSAPPAYADEAPARAPDQINGDSHPCYKDDLNKCKADLKAAGAGLQSGIGDALKKNGETDPLKTTQTTANTSTATGQTLTALAATCQKKADDCDKKCEAEDKKKPGGKAVESCKKDFKDLIAGINAQATISTTNGLEMSSFNKSMSADGPSGTNSSATTAATPTPAPKAEGGGGMGSMMSSMMPMAMMGAMLAMQGSKSDDKDDAQQAAYAQSNYSAVQANGTVDCSKPDGGYYSDCNTYLAATCQQAIASNSLNSNPGCTTFASRYCGTGASSVYTAPYVGVNYAATPGQPAPVMPTMGQAGEGRASSFCTNVMAYNYCQAGGRGACPSCQNLNQAVSTGCAQNPALCLGQTSPTVVAEARTTCPDDPIFSNPAYTTGLVATAPGVLPSTGGVTGAAGAVLGTTAPAILPASASGLQPSSLAGPTSDITGRYGPSVFSTSTQTISKLCQSGQLNCP